jgi:hypothetical protein
MEYLTYTVRDTVLCTRIEALEQRLSILYVPCLHISHQRNRRDRIPSQSECIANSTRTLWTIPKADGMGRLHLPFASHDSAVPFARRRLG